MIVWKGHTAKLRSLAFAPDGRRIATVAGNSKFVWLWDATTGGQIRKLSSAKDGAMRHAAFAPDGAHIVGLQRYRLITVWHAETGVRVATLDPGTWYYPDTFAITPDGSRLLVFTGSQMAEWDDPTMPTPGTRRADRTHSWPQGWTTPLQMGYSPSGAHLWVMSHTVRLADPDTREIRRTLFDDVHDRGFDGGAAAQAVGFAADESRVGVAFGHRAAVWRLDDPAAPPVILRGHKQQVRAVGFLPGGGTVLTAAMDGTVRLWDANSGAEQRSFDWGIGKVRVAAVSPDGTMCAAGSDDGRLVVWDVDV